MKRFKLMTLSLAFLLFSTACTGNTSSVFDNTGADTDPLKTTVETSAEDPENTDNGSDNNAEDTQNDPSEQADIGTDASEISSSDGGASGYFNSTDINGNPVSQKIFTNAKLNFVNVWGTFCGPCISEMPDLAELSGEYSSDEVQFIGIICDVYYVDDAGEAKKIIKKTGADYTHIICNEDMFDWGVDDMEYVPTTLLIDSEGNILDSFVGSRSKAEWKSIIDSELKN